MLLGAGVLPHHALLLGELIAPPDLMITDLLDLRVHERPDAPFLVTETSTWTFAQAQDAARRFAEQLAQAGVTSGDHVALAADNSAGYVVAFLGIAWLGAVVVALDPDLVGDSLGYALAQSDTKHVVADARWLEAKGRTIPGLPTTSLGDDRTFAASLERVPPAPGARVGTAAPCTLLYTSGTTGRPKGVVNSHACYVAVGRDTVGALALTPADRVMVFLPLFHANPQMYALMSALTIGCALIVRPRFSANRFFDDARRFGATGVTFVGTVLAMLAARVPGPVRDHPLRFAIGGGAPVAVWKQIHERFGFRVHELYGMTEIGGWVTCNTAAAYRMGSVGRVRRCMDVRVFDDTDREVPVGTIGEIVVRPLEPNVILSGYYKQPDELVRRSANFWYHTGDRGSFDSDGYLYFHGRQSELVRRGGVMIAPAEIEARLGSLAGVGDCAVVGVPDPIMGEELKAVIVAEVRPTIEAILEHLRADLPRHMLPRYVEFAAAIPKTETAKIQRHKLRYLNEAVYDVTARSYGSPNGDGSL